MAGDQEHQHVDADNGGGPKPLPPPGAPVSVENAVRRQRCGKTCREWIGLAVQGAGLIGLIVYAWLTGLMWREMQSQTKVQRQATMNTERAWLGLDGPIKLDELETKTRFAVASTYIIKNFGHGPALKVVTSGFVVTDPKDIDSTARFVCESAAHFSTGTVPHTPDFKNPGPLGHQLFTAQTSEEHIGTLATPWQGDAQPKLNAIWLIGCVAYFDQFKVPHWTRFCMGGGYPNPPLDVNAPLDYCNRFNDTDETPALSERESVNVSTNILHPALEANGEPDPKEQAKMPDWMTGIGTVLLVIVAIGQLVLFWWQLRLMRTSVNDAEAAARVAEAAADASKQSADVQSQQLTITTRAYVFAGSLRWISHFDEKQQKVFWRIHPHFINRGNTATRDLRVGTAHLLKDSDLPINFSFDAGLPVEQRPVMLIPPHDTIGVGYFDVFGDELYDVKLKRKKLFIWGDASYRDIYPTTPRHITRFCIVVEEITGDPREVWNDKTNPVELIPRIYGSHNCVDDECEPPKTNHVAGAGVARR
jgi:hypothetical protein